MLLRWPEEDSLRARLSVTGDPRLLLVEGAQDPPVVMDCLEDWIRMPAPDVDLAARIEALSGRISVHRPEVPVLDPDGVLRFGAHWVALPPLEARLTQSLLDRFGAVAGREVLSRAGWPAGSPGRNALDVHVLRLRRRLIPLGLVIRTVRSRGYLLEPRPVAEGA